MNNRKKNFQTSTQNRAKNKTRRATRIEKREPKPQQNENKFGTRIRKSTSGIRTATRAGKIRIRIQKGQKSNKMGTNIQKLDQKSKIASRRVTTWEHNNRKVGKNPQVGPENQ